MVDRNAQNPLPLDEPQSPEIQGSKPEFMLATPENISTEELRRLTGNLVLQTFHSHESHDPRVLAQMMDLFVENPDVAVQDISSLVREKLGETFGGDVSIPSIETVRNIAGDNFQELFEGELMSVMRIFNDKKLFIAKVNDRAVSMVGYRRSRKDFHGRPLFEIKKNSTLPDFEGKRLNSPLRDKIIEEITQQHPDACIMTITATPKLKDMYLAKGWKNAGNVLGDAEMVRAATVGIPDNYMREMGEAGYEVIYLDVANQK